MERKKRNMGKKMVRKDKCRGRNGRKDKERGIKKK